MRNVSPVYNNISFSVSAPTLAASPVKTPSYHSPTAMSSSGSSGRRSNLFIILGIVIGIIFIGIISVLIFCLCTFLPKANAPPGETGKYLQF